VPRLRPEVASWRLRRCNMHVDHAMLTPNEMDVMPSNEKVSLTTTLITKLMATGNQAVVLCEWPVGNQS
jgi:hypothetical protein